MRASVHEIKEYYTRRPGSNLPGRPRPQLPGMGPPNRPPRRCARMAYSLGRKDRYNMPVFLSVLIIGAIVLFGVVKITKAACEQREKEKIEA